MIHSSFGDLLRQYCARKHGLTQTRLAHMIGYDQAVLTRMSQGRKELTGPSGRERVVKIIAVLRDEGVLSTQAEANALLKAGGMSPLYEGQAGEAALLHSLQGADSPLHSASAIRSIPTNLTTPLARFIGREREMAEIARLLGATRLLTLTGAGGAGKTRMAVETGIALLGCGVGQGPFPSAPIFHDGIWLVQLASISNPMLVADAVAATLGLRAAGRPAWDMIADHLQDRSTLLILDNCEHLIGACAELTEALLKTCPHLRILATSREGLNIPGESTWRVPSLVGNEAVQLFVERAHASMPGFVLTEQNTAGVTQICTQLDGIPLAIELAAARLRTFSVEQMNARLNDRFRLLTSGARTALPRHQTLHALIDWSYELLSPDEQRLLRHLSVFAGGWTLDSVETLDKMLGGSLDVIGLLPQLVNKSLASVEQGTNGSRYAMLETIRQYAHEKLIDAGEHERAHGAHMQLIVHMIGEAQAGLHGPQELLWLDQLDAEVDNIRGALGWCAPTGDIRSSEQLVQGLWYWWYARGYLLEAQRWIELVLPDTRTLDRGTARATARIAMGWMATRTGHMTHSNQLFAEALHLARQEEDDYLIILAGWGFDSGALDHEPAIGVLNESLRLARAKGMAWETAGILLQLSFRMNRIGNLVEAGSAWREALILLRDAHDIHAALSEQQLLAIEAMLRADADEERVQHEQCVVHARALREPTLLADHLIFLARVSARLPGEPGVLAAAQEAIVIYYKAGNLDRQAECASFAAGVKLMHGDLIGAARLLGAADAMWRPYRDNPIQQYQEQEFRRLLPLVRASLPPSKFETAWTEGQCMTPANIMAEVVQMQMSDFSEEV